MMSKRAIEAILLKSRNDPAWWIRTVLGKNPWEMQVAIMESVRDNPETAVASCHGAGKSFIGANTALWFLYTHKPSIVITTAPTDRQVRGILWKEIRMSHSSALKPLGGRLLSQELKLDDNWWAWGFTAPSYDPNRFQGFHEQYVLVVADEAAGISEEIYEGIDGVLSSEHARLLMIGNPTNAGGRFGKAFKTPGVAKFKISAFDTPNFTHFGITEDDILSGEWRQKMTDALPHPYLVTPHWVERMSKKGVNSPFYQCRVLAKFPSQEPDTLIPLDWIDSAVRRNLRDDDPLPVELGVDVARFGTNETVVTLRTGNRAEIIKRFRHIDTMQTAGQVARLIQDCNAEVAKIDADGIGAGVYDRLKEQHFPVRAMHSGAKARDDTKFINARAEWWWNLRSRFEEGTIDIEDDDDLISQLSNIKYKLNSQGRIQVESKEDMRKRGVESPDLADSLMLAFAQAKNPPARIRARSSRRR